MTMMASVDIAFTNSTQIANAAAQTANNALLSADGKNQVYYQADPPTGTSFAINDLWFDTDNGYAISRWNGSTWVLSKFDFNALNVNKLSAISADLGNVTAGNITGVTMNLAGGKVIVDASGNATFSGSLNGASGTFSGDLSGGTIYCDGTSGGRFLYTNAIDVNPNTVGINLYLRAKATGEIRATLTGTTDTYVPIRADSLIANAVDVNTATSAINVYVRPKIGGEVRVTLTGTTDAYAPIRADSLIANAIDINTLITGATHIYVRPKSGGEVKFTTTGSTTSYTNVRGSLAYFDGIANNTGTNLYLGTTTEVYVTSVGMGANNPIVWQPIRADGFKGDYLDSNPSNAASTNVYIRPKVGGEVRATETGGTTTYVPVRASSFPTGSMAEYKQDIEEWNECALDLINSATIYQYRLISEVEAGRDRVRQGLVIGEGYNTPEGVKDGDGVEQYLMNSWSWKGIQELFTKFTDLDTNVQALSTQVTDLLSKFTDLDARVTNLEAVS